MLCGFCNRRIKRLGTVNNSINMFDFFLTYFFTSFLRAYLIKSVFILLNFEAGLSYELQPAPFNSQPIWLWAVWPKINYFQWQDMVFVGYNKGNFVRGEYRRPGSTIFIHDIDCNKLNLAQNFWVYTKQIWKVRNLSTDKYISWVWAKPKKL